MSYLFFSVAIVFALYLIGLMLNHDKDYYEFMSFKHMYYYRGIAALYVILCHMAGAFGIRYLTPLGGVGVAIFLISSGYGLNESYKKHKRLVKDELQNKNIVSVGGGYWRNKLIRVYFPYFVILLVILFTSAIQGDIQVIQYWYLTFILLWYVVFYLIIKIRVLNKYKYLILCITSVCVFVFSNYSLWVEQAISFTVGVFISDNLRKSKDIITNKFSVVLFFLVGSVLLALKQLPGFREMEDSLLWYLIQLIMKMSYALFTIGIIYVLQKLCKSTFFYLSGLISYELYLVHYSMLPYLNGNYIKIVLFILFSYGLAFLLNKITTFVYDYTKAK